MIRVTVDLISARTGRATRLGRAEIANDGRTLLATRGRRGSYDVQVWGKKKLLREARVEMWPRRSRTAWDLVLTALRAAFLTESVARRGEEEQGR